MDYIIFVTPVVGTGISDGFLSLSLHCVATCCRVWIRGILLPTAFQTKYCIRNTGLISMETVLKIKGLNVRQQITKKNLTSAIFIHFQLRKLNA